MKTTKEQDVVEALKLAAELISTARQYFPKSIKNRDTWSLNLTGVTISKALDRLGVNP